MAELSHLDRDGSALRTVICKDCGLVWSDPLPMDVAQYYEHDYRLDYKAAYTPKPKHIYRAGLVALERLKKINNAFKPGGSLLDVGSGGGEFLYLMNQLGYQTQGIEPNQGYARYSMEQYGLQVLRGFVQEANFPPQHFDGITIWHVLEHTADPAATLTLLKNWLKPGGTLVVEVPNVEAVCQSPKGRFHRAHIFNFNQATLETLGKKVGLVPLGTLHSADGGNLTARFQLPAATGAAQSAAHYALPGNYSRIEKIVREHGNLSHYLSGHPYRRAWRKLLRARDEARAVGGLSGGKEILNACYRAQLASQNRARDASTATPIPQPEGV